MPSDSPNPSSYRTWRMPGMGGGVYVALRTELDSNTEWRRLAIPLAAARRWVEDPFARRAALALVELVSGSVSPRTSNVDLARRLAQLFERDILVLVDQPAAGSILRGGMGAAPQSPPPEPPAKNRKGDGASTSGGEKAKGGSSAAPSSNAAPPPAGPPPLTWIEIHVVDEDGKPLDGEDYEFTRSDGAVLTGTLSAGKAFLRADDIPPGTCKLKLPNLHKNGWTAPGKTR